MKENKAFKCIFIIFKIKIGLSAMSEFFFDFLSYIAMGVENLNRKKYSDV